MLLLDPLFHVPFATGLAFAILLPLAGMYLRLRNEWLAALAFAQMASAGTLLAAMFSLPAQAGGLMAALGTAGVKSFLPEKGKGPGGSAYALILLAGWSLSVLVVSNVPVAEHLGHALFDGQLFFADASQMWLAWVYLLLALAALRFLSRPLLLCRFFPDFFRARGRSELGYLLAFDLLSAGALALATAGIGVMAAFAFVFIPPRLAFGLGGSWRRALLWSLGLGLGAYLAAFAVALLLDQAFGPVSALLLVTLAMLVSGLMTFWGRKRSAN